MQAMKEFAVIEVQLHSFLTSSGQLHASANNSVKRGPRLTLGKSCESFSMENGPAPCFAPSINFSPSES